MKSMLSVFAALAFVVSVGASANQLAAEKAIVLADAVEALDTTLHDLGQDQKAEAVHSLEAVVLNVTEVLEHGEASKAMLNTEMNNLYNQLMNVIRVVRGNGCGVPAIVHQKLNAVTAAYRGLFYVIYPPQPTPCRILPGRCL